MKKFISSLVSVALLAATIVLPASAETEDYADYATWEVTAVNRIKLTNRYHLGDPIGYGAGSPTNIESGGFAQFVYDAAEMTTHSYGMGFNGTSMTASQSAALTSAYYNWNEWKVNTDYVVKFDLKNESIEGVNPTFWMFMRSYTVDETVESGRKAYYDWAPVDVTVTGDETQEYIETFTTGDTYPEGIALRMGFGSGETVSGVNGRVVPRPEEGSAVGVKISTMYVAEEQIAEIKNEALGSNIITAGGSLEAKAQIVNQLGTTGNIAQEFTYIALNADRTEMVEDISIVPGENGAYTINIEETVAEGNYVILARAGQSTDEKLLQKGLEISVVNPETVDWTDHATAEVTAQNRIKLSNRYHLGNPYLSGAGNPMNNEVGGFAQYIYSPSDMATNGTGFNGTQMTGVISPSLSSAYYNWYEWKANTNYVIKFDFKNFSPEGVYPTFVMYLKSSETDASTGSAVTKRDWAIVDINVSGDETQEFVQTFSTGDANPESTDLRMGFGTGETVNGVYSPKTAEGSIVGLKVSSMYIAEEQIAEIKNEAPAKVFAGESGKGKVEVVNQVGDKGKIPQDHDLLVLNADRTEIAEGVTAVKGANGEYTINVDENAASGEYVVLATATNTGDVFLQKGATIEVVNFAELDLSDKSTVEVTAQNKFVAPITSGYVLGDLHGTGAGHPADEVVNGFAQFVYSASDMDQHKYASGFNGMNLKGTINGNLNESYFNWVVWEANKDYVVKLVTKNGSAEGITPTFLMCFNTYQDDVAQREFVLTDITVTGDETQEIIKTFTTGNTESTNTGIRLGFGSGETMNGQVIPRPQDGSVVGLQLSSLYIAEEQAAEISNVATSSTVVMPGETISAKAEILNQVGTKGKLAQDIEFMVLDGDRTEKLDNFTVTEGENGAYTINVPKSAEAGNYVVLAMNDATGLQLGLEFTVVDSFADTAKAAAPKNMLTVPNSADNFMYKYGISPIDYLSGSELQFTYATDQLVRSQAINGSRLPYTDLGAARFNWTQVEADSDYLVTFKMKNNSAEGITPKFGVQLRAGDETNSIRVWDIVDVTEREDWQEYSAVLHTDVAGTSTSFFLVGFPTGGTNGKVDGIDVPSTPEGSVVVIDMSSVSITKVAPVEVKVTEVADADTYTLKAEVVNQAGTTEGISGQNFTWYAMNTDRTEVVDGITLTPSADTTTVTVEADDTVADGTYSIVAIAEDYGMIKGFNYVKAPAAPVEFAVTGAEFGFGDLTVSCEGIPKTGKTIVVYFAKYVNNVFSGAEVKPIAFDGTSATGSDTVSFTTGNYAVKAFIWDTDMNALLDNPLDY